MKYLELIKGQFTADHEARAKQEEPYVAYSEEAGGVMYTFIPEPVVGPADNEIWYTTEHGGISNYRNHSHNSNKMVSNTYTDMGCVVFRDSITVWNGNYDEGCSSFYSLVDGECIPGEDITSITLPQSIEVLGREALSGLSNLSSIIIPNSVTSIGDYAFRGCRSLPSIIIPNSVTSIGWGAFESCRSLASITIPNSVTSIESYAFRYCSSLTSITFEGTMEQWNSITNGSDLNHDAPAIYVQCSDGQVAL